MKKSLLLLGAGLMLLAASCSNTTNTNINSEAADANAPTPTNQEIIMTIASPAFAANATIPKQYTCDGASMNPPLSFSDVPSDAKSLALLMDDPDVPKNLKPDGVFDHWVLYNIPPTTTAIPESASGIGTPGQNGSGKAQYTGPCPPDREHRYFFKLYALDTMLSFNSPPTKAQVEQAMQGHILDQAELVAKYDRPR
jgi:Raf kinase inhibitor-like YbhB/YbcL family protein